MQYPLSKSESFLVENILTENFQFFLCKNFAPAADSPLLAWTKKKIKKLQLQHLAAVPQQQQKNTPRINNN